MNIPTQKIHSRSENETNDSPCPLRATIADSTIPFFVWPSHWYRPYHRDIEFDATESMSFVKYILATNSSSRRLRCSRHRNGYIVVVRLAATRFAEIPENRDSRIATSLARRVEEGRRRGSQSPVLDPPRALLHRSVFLSRRTDPLRK